jgi:SOS-response transcriptional repressor LexA
VRRASERQLEVLQFIVSYTQEHGYQPSRREMAEAFGVTRSAITGRLKDLERRGYVCLSNPGDRAVILMYVRFRAYFDQERELKCRT